MVRDPTARGRLRLLGLPVIESLTDLSEQSRLSPGKLYVLSKHSHRHYRVYQLPKPSGGVRTIAQPSRELKAIQSWILTRVLADLRASSASTGFARGMSVVDNATPHIGARVVACLDIENFFPSIPASWIFNIFVSLGYSNWIAYVLTELTTFRGGLPQGAPSSPKLANLACQTLDRRILGYVGRRGIAYTRYADDLTFSAFSTRVVAQALPFVRRIITDEGFGINEQKTRIAGPSRRQRVTGLVITDSGVGIGREALRTLRSRINDLRHIPSGPAAMAKVEHIRGWLAHLEDVDPDRCQILKRYISALGAKAPTSAVTRLLT